MKQIALTIVVLMSLSSIAESNPDVTSLYSGVARVTDLNSGLTTSEQVFLIKTASPSIGQLIETACVIPEAGEPRVSGFFMKIEGQQILAISDRPTFDGMLTGSGRLQGPAWNWTYLRFDMTMNLPNGSVITIDDENFVVNGKLIARKRMYYDNLPFQLWDIEMDTTKRGDFVSGASDFGCPTEFIDAL